jgi:hypothetical protein
VQLVRYETARQALAEAHRVDEVKDIRDKAQALAAYARQAKDTDLIAWATEIKVRAERRAGEMLRVTAERGERRGAGNPQLSQASTIGLDDLNITRDQSSRWQKLAAMPDEHFETAVATAKAQTGEVTTAHMLRVAEALDDLGKARAMVDAQRASTPEDVERALAAKRAWADFDYRLGKLTETIAELRTTSPPPMPPELCRTARQRWLTVAEFLSHHIEGTQ